MFKFLINILIKIGLTNKKLLFRTLSKIEYGISIFCIKLAKQANRDNYFNLEQQLIKHSKEEKKHGKMLTKLIDGIDGINLDTDNGRFIEITNLNTGEIIIDRNKENLNEIYSVNWDSVFQPGVKLTGLYEKFDGISKRYLSSRILFNNKAAADYSWEDKLTFMYLLEQKTNLFYIELAKQMKEDNIKNVLLKISNEEKRHYNYLEYGLRQFTMFPKYYIDKWNNKINLAMFALIFDLFKLLIK